MSVSLTVEKRELRPRSLRNQLRHAGKIPAIVFGYEVENTPVALDAAEFAKILRQNGAHTVFEFSIDGKKVNALIGEVQQNTFSRAIEHLELISVNMSEAVEFEVELVIVGEDAVAKAGLVVSQGNHTVKVSAKPDKLPESLAVDITKFGIGDSFTVADLPTSPDYTITTDPTEHILTVFEKQEEPEETDETVVEPVVEGEEEKTEE